MIVEKVKVKLPDFIASSLPANIIFEIERTSNLFLGRLEEIRLRRGRKSEYVFSGKGVLGDRVVDEKEINEIFFRLCQGSVYAYEEGIRWGYIRAKGGIRIGVVGSAVLNGEKIETVHDISSLNIRLPCPPLGGLSSLVDSVDGVRRGVLIFSPPGVGKTTFLRSLAYGLATEKGKRVALIDTNGELSAGLDTADGRIDILDGYPRGIGIEIAIRAMNPHFVVCDEIGNMKDAEALLGAVSCGVKILATAHGDELKGLILRPGISELYRAGAFDKFLALYREEGRRRCLWRLFDIGETEQC